MMMPSGEPAIFACAVRPRGLATLVTFGFGVVALVSPWRRGGVRCARHRLSFECLLSREDPLLYAPGIAWNNEENVTDESSHASTNWASSSWHSSTLPSSSRRRSSGTERLQLDVIGAAAAGDPSAVAPGAARSGSADPTSAAHALEQSASRILSSADFAPHSAGSAMQCLPSLAGWCGSFLAVWRVLPDVHRWWYA